MSEVHDSIKSITDVIVAAGVLYSIYISRRTAKHLVRQDVKLDELHSSTNGLSERLQATAKALGIAIGTAEEKERNKGE